MNSFNKPLSTVDPELYSMMQAELKRQQTTLEMIASENFAPQAVLEAQGSVLTNKYAEGYPGKRYYGGCEHVDMVEELAISRAKTLFNAEYVNVQPHSGSTASAAVLHAFAEPGDTILGLELSHGGHLTHGMKLNFSGRNYNAVSYRVHPETFLIDMNHVEHMAVTHKPKIIIAGWSAYSRIVDFQHFRDIADKVGAKLWVDMAHFSGLVAAGEHPNPVPYADVVSSTVHKTLGGPRSGFIMSRDVGYTKLLNTAVFPGQQGGPLMHAIAGKAVAFKLANTEEFKNLQKTTTLGAQTLAEAITSPTGQQNSVKILTGGTEVHLILLDLSDTHLTGLAAENILHKVGITVNRNSIPYDTASPMVTSGIRIGTPALATRGFTAEDFRKVGKIITETLSENPDIETLKKQTLTLAEKHPLYTGREI